MHREVASRLLRLSYDFTQGKGFHIDRGGHDSDINMTEDICFTDSRDLKDVPSTCTFILLNPRSHAAVLTGTVSIKFITCVPARKIAL